ncbi:hypothetical protein ACS0TY_008268 [Phlomoides rotata]
MAAESSTASTSSRSGGGGASADSYIGSLISLTSKSEIRYEGVLYNINTEESSIGLRNVRSFGTEGRKKDGPQVPPSDKIYEYILFRGSDIKDLQVKASPPVQTPPSINSDPAIIQSHYPRPTTPPTSLPTAPTGSLADHGSHSSQVGHPGSTFPSNLHLYQPGGNLNSWGPSPPNVNGSGLAMPMYWQGFYGTPNGLPQLHTPNGLPQLPTPNGLPQLPQQSLLRPPPGLSVPPSLQQMQFPGFSASLPTTASSLSNSTMPDYHSSLVPSAASSSSLTSSLFTAPTMAFNVPPLQPHSLASEPVASLPNRAPIAIPMSNPSSSLTSLGHLPTSVPDNAGLSSVASKPGATLGPAVLPQQTVSPPLTSVPRASSSVLTKTMTPSLITPGQLLHSGPTTVPAPQSLQTTQKDVEVVQVSSEPSVSAVTEPQPPILPLPHNTRAQKPNGGAYYMRNNYRGRGGRGSGVSRPMTKFTEDFDFMAMNEKFKKDEVWGHLGKGNKSQSKDKDGNESGSDEHELQDDEDAEVPKVEATSVYNKDDFFDSLSCNALDNGQNNGRTRYSEQMKLDTETFGEFSRYRGGRGGRGPGRGGGRYTGSYHGRGGYGYGYGGRGRGRGMQYRAP